MENNAKAFFVKALSISARSEAKNFSAADLGREVYGRNVIPGTRIVVVESAESAVLDMAARWTGPAFIQDDKQA